MLITPIAFSVDGEAISFGPAAGLVPLPPWSGVPVGMQLEVERPTLARLLETAGEGLLHARDEDGASICCPAAVEPDGCHTCETDTVLMLVQCGPFELEKPSGEEAG